MNDPFCKALELLDGVCSGRIGVEEFQQKLEPALNNLPPFKSKVDQKFKELVNRLEIIVFTQRSEDQPTAAIRLAAEIKKYLQALFVLERQ